jgi:hypothetical protein
MASDFASDSFGCRDRRSAHRRFSIGMHATKTGAWLLPFATMSTITVSRRQGRMARKLKVFRTAIGFHDAYVAAPSRKAALEAWGSDRNLFASALAEEVTDPALTTAPLADPGKVVKVRRGSSAENMAALAETRPRRRASSSKPALPRATRPSRAALDKAEAAVGRAEASLKQELATIDAEMEALRKRRRAVMDARKKAISELRERLYEVRTDYEAAVDRWRQI